ncbi:hypothetical protein QEJ31_08325 [Pigmentibacter sp. JX0631]|uniref:hypothetical protein n=1 Tax=Pigmentibacter sp. JX0631 TaxID=2976982 RepID=UPI00246959D1|nr:hypothetical protein [Pigmentibacter sp. JX0631]WGL58545.1 hypothetical protein QEJ31_08325 [Pigmentibacter sp. JX0631]
MMFLKNKILVLSIISMNPVFAGNLFSSSSKVKYEKLRNEYSNPHSNKHDSKKEKEIYNPSLGEILIINQNIQKINVYLEIAKKALNYVYELHLENPWYDLDDSTAEFYTYSYSYAKINFDKLLKDKKNAEDSLYLLNGINISEKALENAFENTKNVIRNANYDCELEKY